VNSNSGNCFLLPTICLNLALKFPVKIQLSNISNAKSNASLSCTGIQNANKIVM
jgi:hypothetical protein